MDYVVESRELSAQATMARLTRLSIDRVGPWLAETYALIVAYLDRVGAPIGGQPYARYTFAGNVADVEAGFPVAAPVPPSGDIVRCTLPAVTAAVTVHIGPYERLQDAYKAVHAWIVEHGGVPTGGHWEIYYDDPASQPDGSRWRTDVVVPYRPASRDLRP